MYVVQCDNCLRAELPSSTTGWLFMGLVVPQSAINLFSMESPEQRVSREVAVERLADHPLRQQRFFCSADCAEQWLRVGMRSVLVEEL